MKPWKDLEEPSVHIPKCKRPTWKGCVCMIPWHDILEKAKLCRQRRGQRVTGVAQGERTRRHRGCGGQWKSALWYSNDGYTSLYICLNPQNARQERTLMALAAFGWWWCVSVGSSAVTNVYHCRGDADNGAGCASGEMGICMGNLCTFHSILPGTLNCYEKKNLFFFFK